MSHNMIYTIPTYMLAHRLLPARISPQRVVDLAKLRRLEDGVFVGRLL